jgi:hypothetical protein
MGSPGGQADQDDGFLVFEAFETYVFTRGLMKKEWK